MRCPLTEEDKEFIRNNYKDMTDKELAKHCGCTDPSITNFRSRERLLKGREFASRWAKKTVTDAFLANSFKKGHAPMNKGKPAKDWASPDVLEKMKRTQFKKGHISANNIPLGAITWRAHNKRKTGYYYIKVRNGSEQHNMVLLHRHIWEEAHGPIPPGKILVFKDKNTRNCTLENLELIDKRTNMGRNTIHRYPEELKHMIRLVGKAQRTLNNERSKHK